MKNLILFVVAVVTLSSCYEYRKLPNIKRVTKRQVRKAMKYSSWEYDNTIPQQTYNTTYRYPKK